MRPDPEDGAERARLFAYNAGFLAPRIRRILALAGHDLRLGLPGPGDRVAVWGNSPTAHRGRRIAAARDVPLLHVEDAFLRSLRPGRLGEPPLGLLLDESGLHFDPRSPSDLETLLATHPLDDTALLDRARLGITRLRELHLSKYSALDPGIAAPEPGYVLVVDQLRGDASVTASNGSEALFREMLVFAQEENPGARVVIKTHPETASGLRPGHFSARDENHRISLLDAPLSPWSLLEGAVGVYTLSSQMGFEAILAGHKPRVFGQPFYAGWGLTRDENPVPRRARRITAAQLFAGAMILYPTWYDPCRDRLCSFENMLDMLAALARAWREDHRGWTASGMRLWKRPHLQRFFGGTRRVRFAETPAPGDTGRHMVWAGRAGPEQADAVRIEDGFLRSRGLGARLVPPLSLVCDTQGIYYDPTRPSDLEDLIAKRRTLRPDQRQRAERVIARLTGAGLTKYNQGGAAPDLPQGYRILVPGQVEDDASLLTGGGTVRRNADLLRTVRKANPGAVIVYKPHPDVEAGLREGAIAPGPLADAVAAGTDPAALLEQVQEVWTMTSLMGFEALLRGLPVTTLGAPFFAGWGLTTDLGPVPVRRGARPDLAGLVHAALIDYPRYFDPVSGLPCPVEVALDRLSDGPLPRQGPGLRLLSRLQGLLASAPGLWR
ncbi:capsular polysaccharide export protein [Cribrihabitans marinus]|uniref:Capsular polysaccharide export protein n=1 Tax=Cribrihabitans marinus TaxID=1227549 RepID=A0A1H6R6H9_9RHOB|nr:capsular polysaccharide biosynthesis protein [Cribrihabitans marinus]GGH20561.1 capsular polysaccharide biosynthesis protein [Cribrihabitans marinus]SEI51333.1 capsular polysaccharide export protein [Cribrihabitans marinus]